MPSSVDDPVIDIDAQEVFGDFAGLDRYVTLPTLDEERFPWWLVMVHSLDAILATAARDSNNCWAQEYDEDTLAVGERAKVDLQAQLYLGELSPGFFRRTRSCKVWGSQFTGELYVDTIGYLSVYLLRRSGLIKRAERHIQVAKPGGETLPFSVAAMRLIRECIAELAPGDVVPLNREQRRAMTRTRG